MMKKICLIGPFPPPMNGNSKALDTIVKSEEFNKNFECFCINLNQTTVGHSGRFSFEKVNSTKEAIAGIKQLRNKKIDCFYLTTAQSTFGLIRDYLIVNIIKHYNKSAGLVAHLHGGGFRNFYNKSNVIIKWLARNTYCKIDRVIVLSDSLVKMFEGIYPTDKISVIYNCVDNEFLFDRESVKEKSIREIRNVTYLSNMIESKGYKYVIKAAQRMKDEFPEIHFSFAGAFPSDEEELNFRRELESSLLNKTVRYLGIVSGENKKELLAKTDVFVLPTRYPPEGQPISIIEAMSSGAIIITSDQGGIPDIIADGINGFIMKENFDKSIVEDIINLRKCPELKKSMSMQNYNDVREKFTESHYIEGLISELMKVCK